MTQKDKRNMLISVLLLSQIMTSCSDSTEQEASRSIRSSTIVNYSENNTEQVIVTDSSSIVSKETTEPTWGGGPADKPKEFIINLSFSENLKVFDYGKRTVNVYQARHDIPSDSWGNEWCEYGYGEIKEWCEGNPVSIDGVEWFYPSREVSLENIRRVTAIELNEIEGWEEIASRTGMQAEDTILCWEYDVFEFPQFFNELPYFIASTDVNEIRYARISTQYVDNLPIYGTASCHGDYCTFEWEGVIESARIAVERTPDSQRINPNHTCIFEIYRDKYRIEKTLRKDIPVVDPQTCLAEIETAIKYNPLAISGGIGILDIWEKDIEVYCMELTYVALESNPREFDEPEESIKLHDVYLVPAWEVYYVISDPQTKEMSCEKVLINAATGKSLYSDSFGPGENTELYPDLLLPG